MKLLILSILWTNSLATLTFTVPANGTIYLDYRCSDEKVWRSGWVNKQVTTGTNTISCYAPCSSGMIQLRLITQ